MFLFGSSGGDQCGVSPGSSDLYRSSAALFQNPASQKQLSVSVPGERPLFFLFFPALATADSNATAAADDES